MRMTHLSVGASSEVLNFAAIIKVRPFSMTSMLLYEHLLCLPGLSPDQRRRPFGTFQSSRVPDRTMSTLSPPGSTRGSTMRPLASSGSSGESNATSAFWIKCIFSGLFHMFRLFTASVTIALSSWVLKDSQLRDGGIHGAQSTSSPRTWWCHTVLVFVTS